MQYKPISLMTDDELSQEHAELMVFKQRGCATYEDVRRLQAIMKEQVRRELLDPES